ncbi:hypothetical protein CLI92_09070 [Vandammella animalimorsus]|uniref:Uncharacterized protein n=1 Tax=Vandammella animalimorsus TaxID=2029117 RepID=A0A2A2T4P6_9BURK|nr:hypothetical protein [Vandammella animalimorsus]PAT31879.1 hypothetical protein CK626_07735 [Vandammella animalimorsus]PAX16474.1 hypothetical protein CLI92_09070 [Vandammella animalimorsus]PAX18889.1 hypothetical protein CLI93_11150 [Vandammella animalimorsus]
MARRFFNAARAELSSNISASTTTLHLAPGGSMPALASSDRMTAVLQDEVGIEIVEVTASNGSALTVIRGREGTVARSFARGSVVGQRLTAADAQRWDAPPQWGEVQGKPAFGTAAYAALTTSTGDGTAGHVLRVGDHGIGDYLPHRSNLDLNHLPYKTTAFAGHNLTNVPAGAGWVVVQQWVSNANLQDILQCVSYLHSVGEHIYYRRKRSGAWQPWQRLALADTPMELRNKTFSGHKESPYIPDPSLTSQNTTINLDNAYWGLQYLRPGTANTMTITYSRGLNDSTDQGRSVLVYLRPQANVTIAAHAVVAWPDGLNRASPVFPANRTSVIHFQHVHFPGDRALWYAKPSPGTWNA